ncbi:cell division protein FtsB [Vibrio sp.]|nr:cell division protein FtsB [Vibrio sp.]
MRLFIIVLMITLSWLQYQLWFGKNGIDDYFSTVEEIESLELVNQSLRERNAQIFAEIDDLNQGLDAIEERARHELGLVKEGETFYRLISKDEQ